MAVNMYPYRVGVPGGGFEPATGLSPWQQQPYGLPQNTNKATTAPVQSNTPVQPNNTGGGGGTGNQSNPLSGLPGMPNYQQQYGGSPQLPNLDLSVLGNTNGAGGAPQIPDFLGQASGQFNNFQGMDLGADLSNLGNMFGSYNERANERSPMLGLEGPITQQMQDRMLNSTIGANRAQRSSSMRDATNRLGTRGFTSESPALQATSNRLGLNEALANTQARTDIPIQAARENAQYRLGAFGANTQARGQDQQNFLGLENAKTNRISPLLQALVGLV